MPTETPTETPADSPEFDKVSGVLGKILPKGVDPLEIWSALKDAGLTIASTTAPEALPGLPREAAPSGAPVDGEPQEAPGGFAGMSTGGPPTDDLVRAAFQASQEERSKNPL